MAFRIWRSFVGAVVLAAVQATAAAAQPVPAAPCRLVDAESRFGFRWLSADEQASARKIHSVLCQQTATGTAKWTLPTASAFINSWMFWHAACDKTEASESFFQSWIETPAHKAITGAGREFCRRTQMTSAVREVAWLRSETFCHLARYTANPGGWRSFVKPTTESWQRLEALATSLCKGLRDNTISLDNAMYQWEQEQLWVSEHLPTEMGKAAAALPLNLLNGAVDLLSRVVSLAK